MNNQRHLRDLLFVAAFILVGRQAVHAEDCSIGVTVTAVKPSYTQDESIAIHLAFNGQGTPESLMLAYPSLQFALRFTPKGALVQSGDLPGVGEVLVGPLRLPAWRTLTTQIYLQRFLDGFHAGHYEVPWEISVRCVGKEKPVTAKGLLDFDITSGQSPGLQSEYAGFLSRAQTVDTESFRYRAGDPDVFVENPFRVEEAVEALRIARSPLVIPYLEQLAVNRDSYFRNNAFAGLIKFAGNAEARRFVFQALQSQDGHQITQGLGVLSAWQERLPEIDVRSLLIKNGPTVQVEVLRYLGRSQDPMYRALLGEYANHEDPAVAARAKAAASQLGRQ